MNASYDISPRIVSTEKLIRFAIRARYTHALPLFEKVRKIVFFPVSGTLQYPRREVENLPAIPFTREGDTVFLEALCPEEGEYVIEFCGEKNDGTGLAAFTNFHLYALKPDLYALTPWKGNFHLHSCESDGAQSPVYNAAGSREYGADFIALTDHRKYESSISLIEALKEFETDLKAFPGEEVHLKGSLVHVVNFGSSTRVNALAAEQPERFEAEVKEIEAGISETTNPEVRTQVAMAEWAYTRIREGGGIALFCHPYWRISDHFYVSEEIIDVMLRRRRFDALELFGGFAAHQLEGNMLMLARYTEYIARFGTLNVVGVSDCHNIDGELGNAMFTIVFAENSEFRSLADAIRGGRCVAVQNTPGCFPIIIGEFRLVLFAYFLLREYFPRHDELCRMEGLLLKDAFAGDSAAAEQLKLCKGRVPALYPSMKG